MKTSSSKELTDKIKYALNEQIEALPSSIAHRLTKARQQAIQRQMRMPQPSRRRIIQARLVGTLLPVLFGLFIFIHMAKRVQDKKIDTFADIDAAVLSDPLSPMAYLDHGFNAYLIQNDTSTKK